MLKFNSHRIDLSGSDLIENNVIQIQEFLKSISLIKLQGYFIKIITFYNHNVKRLKIAVIFYKTLIIKK